MSQKIEKPSLTGHRTKHRKREKEKNDPSGFRDAILQGLNEANNDIEKVSKFLDSAGSKLDYRRYAESLFDILFAGGILAPGGSVVQDGGIDKIPLYAMSIFGTKDETASLRAQYEILFKLIRRYKYLEKSFEDELTKLIMFLKGFSEDERMKLAKVVGICLANGLGSPSCLVPLFEDHLVKEGFSIEFATCMFKAWLQEKDIQNVSASLKKAGIEGKLLELLPVTKRTQENFENLFLAAGGLEQIVEYQRVKANAERKKGIQSKLEDMIDDEEPVKEMILLVKDHMTITNTQEHEMVVMAWNTLMNAVEWSKKEELVADQALKHLRRYTALLAALTENGKSELTLLTKIQEYCYDNMNFLKVFQKIVILFYKTDVLSEDSVLKWYEEAHLPKGKRVFLDQMKSFVQWLQNAEEEEESEEEN